MSEVALVTGAASGIGAAVAARLRTDGMAVAGVDLRPPDGVDLALVADVVDRDQVLTAATQARSRLGEIDVLVTPAGHYELLPVDAIDDERWERMLTVHLGGLVNCIDAVLPAMLERGYGAIVSIASELALAGGEGDSHYVAAKGAIVGFTRELALELGARGIAVNCVAPGPTDTPLLDVNARADGISRDEVARRGGALTPLGRIATPDEVADAVAFVIGQGGAYQGAVVSPNAGAVM